VGVDFANGSIQEGEDSLGLTQGIGKEDCGPALSARPGPPGIDLLYHFFLGAPGKSRQAKSTLGYKCMATDRFIGGCQAIVLGFVIPGKHPDLPFVFHPDLGRPDDMPGRVKAEFDPPHSYRFPPVHTGDLDFPKAVPYNGDICFMGDIPAVSPPAVIGVPVGDKCFFNGFPRIQVYIRQGTVDPLIGEFKQGPFHSGQKLRNFLLFWVEGTGGYRHLRRGKKSMFSTGFSHQKTVYLHYKHTHMPIIDLYKHGEGRSNLAHFAALATLANLDNIITKEEKEILDYFAAKLGITDAEYKEVMKEENQYPIESPLTHEERMERLHDFFRIIVSYFDLHKAQLHMVETYAIALGFPPEKAKKIIEKSIKIFSGQINLRDYMYLMGK